MLEVVVIDAIHCVLGEGDSALIPRDVLVCGVASYEGTEAHLTTLLRKAVLAALLHQLLGAQSHVTLALTAIRARGSSDKFRVFVQDRLCELLILRLVAHLIVFSALL